MQFIYAKSIFPIFLCHLSHQTQWMWPSPNCFWPTNLILSGHLFSFSYVCAVIHSNGQGSEPWLNDRVNLGLVFLKILGVQGGHPFFGGKEEEAWWCPKFSRTDHPFEDNIILKSLFFFGQTTTLFLKLI